MNATYRKITTTDFNECANVLVRAYQGEPWNNTWTKEEALLRIEATMSGFNARGFVVEINGDIVAMCLGRIDYYYDGYKQFVVDEFNVCPHFQGKGIGSDFMEYVSKVMKKDEIYQLFLITGGTTSAKFYGKNGFERSVGDYMMYKEL